MVQTRTRTGPSLIHRHRQGPHTHWFTLNTSPSTSAQGKAPRTSLAYVRANHNTSSRLSGSDNRGAVHFRRHSVATFEGKQVYGPWCRGPGASCVVRRCVEAVRSVDAGGSDACDMTSQQQPPCGISKRGHLFSYWCKILTHDKEPSMRTDGVIYRQARTVAALVEIRRLLWSRHAVTWKGSLANTTTQGGTDGSRKKTRDHQSHGSTI